MPPKAEGLTAAKVRVAKPGRYGDGGGLYLLVRSETARFWVFRYTAKGRMREMGLGPAIGKEAVSLADARGKARHQHELVRAGRDPLDERVATKSAEAATARQAVIRAMTFRQIAREYIEAYAASWRNLAHRRQWTTTLETYAFPTLGDVPVAEVGTPAVMGVLEAIWHEKPETASRLRGRIEAVLDYAKARGWRDGENPARWRGHVANLLPPRGKLRPHHPALPWAEISRFLTDLAGRDGIGALALKFLVLSAARTNEVIGATWSEIDVRAAIWTVPAARMKAGREHRVPLSDAALAVLTVVKPLRDDAAGGWVFPGARRGRPLSNSVFLMLLQRMDRGDVTAHGFRSTFRDWAAETAQPADLAEAALAHAQGGKVRAAYQRGDMLERRRSLMQAWATFCAGASPAGEGSPSPDGADE
jgi:integrase